MNGYRRGAIFGLTVAEIFILLAFLLLIALLGLKVEEEENLSQANTSSIETALKIVESLGEERRSQANTSSMPRVWVLPEEIETLVNTAIEAHAAQEQAEASRAIAEIGRAAGRERV